MAYASQSGRARVNAKKPAAFAVCDRCGIWYNHNTLRWQMDWRGTSVQNLRILVCPTCYDRPQEQLRAIVLPADPEPIINARVEDFLIDETDFRVASEPTVIDPITGLPIPSEVFRTTPECNNRTAYPFGRPVGLGQQAVMPFNAGVHRHYGRPLDLLSVTSDGSSTITVTCSRVHNLTTNDILSNQIAIGGLANPAADGTYSVNVTTATAFTYALYGSIPAQALLTPTTLAITCLVGLPRGYTRIPKIYGPTFTPEVEALVCFLEMEDGTGMFMLEDGSGFVQLEQCMQPPLENFFFGLESGTGSILLEDNVNFLEQEDGS